MSVLSVPNTFVPAATILSGQVNANFSAIVTWAGTQPGLTIGAGSIGSAGVTGKWPDQVLNIGTIVSNNFASWRAAVTAIGTATHLWALSDSSGTIAVDAIGSSNGVYVGGPTLGAPLLRQNGVGLSGTGQYVTFPGIELPAAAPWSLECYASYTGASTGYVISSSELQITETTASTTTTTSAVGGAVAFPSYPSFSTSNIAVDSAGVLYLNNGAGSVVRKFTQAGTALTSVTLSNGPIGTSTSGIVVDASGNIYIADGSAALIYKYNSAGTLLTSYTTSQTSAIGVSVDASGLVYTLCANTVPGAIQRFANSGGAATLTFAPPTSCYQLGTDSSGNIYACSVASALVYKFNATGTLTNTFSVAQAGGSGGNNSIPVDSSGNFWVASTSLYNTYKYSSTGTLLATIAQTSGNFSKGLAIDSNNNLYICTADTFIKKYSPTATLSTISYAFSASVQPNHHVITYDGATMRYYVNGTLISSSANTIVTTPGVNLTAGALSYVLGSSSFQGTIANLSIYSSVLTGAQISSLYNSL